VQSLVRKPQGILGVKEKNELDDKTYIQDYFVKKLVFGNM
jgi:hypothetical protein